MARENFQSYIVTSSDPHISEYVAGHWKVRHWISGFTGSNGTLVVTQSECGLWTDGRYFLQAEEQLAGSDIKLFKMGNPGTPSFEDWLERVLDSGDYVGYDGGVFSVSAFKTLKSRFRLKKIEINHSCDLISEIWEDRPAVPCEPVFVHDRIFAGLSAAGKLGKVRGEMAKAGADCYVIGSLDDIAWLCNIRGNDIKFVPVATCYAFISMDEATIFIDSRKLSDTVKAELSQNGIKTAGYEEIEQKLSSLGKGKILFDPKKINCRLYDAINPDCEKEETAEITSRLKAVKNDVETANLRDCHISDGIAMAGFLHWIEQTIGKEKITELDVADKLREFRGCQEHNMGESFSTIAGYGDHGAIIHYSATRDSRYVLENKGLMVVDSGGQYLNGTTDITRTVVFDDVSEEEKHDYTMVLKALIALSSAKFIYGSTGAALDGIARKPLWDAGLDYAHGTGHGVGFFLSVHEGPQGISQAYGKVRLEQGMAVTIEPGLYRAGKHGVRTENIVMAVEDELTEFGQFMRFETMTLCPISLKGIDIDLLTEQEKAWLNDYHARVYEKLSPRLCDSEELWLRQNTRRI